MEKNLNEALSGGELTPSESAPINYIRDNPVVTEIRSYFVKDLKDVDLVKVLEDGDVYHMDLRFVIADADLNTQYAREQGKHRAYDIKRLIEIGVMKNFNIPSMSIQGVRIVRGKKDTWCEFSISFIYANKGNLKPTNESTEKDLRVRALVESTLKGDKPKEIIKEDSALEEIYAEIKETEALEEDGQMPIKEELEEGYQSPNREDALNFLERMGEIKREEKE